MAGLIVALSSMAESQKKPDLQAGGPEPSLIPNHQVTVVTLPGLNLSGAKVTVKGVCKMTGYKVVSDTKIQMSLEGARAITDTEDGCFFTVTTPAGSASGWVSVDLSDEEKTQKEAKQKADDRAKGQALTAAAGKKWEVRFADGATETYTAKPGEEGEMPAFVTSGGKPASIVVRANNSAILIEGECMRSGRLLNGQVKDGTSMGNCSHPGSWSATVH
jgi:hypothetical protein